MNALLVAAVDLVARAQLGLITYEQAVRAGVAPSTIAYLVKQRVWRRVHRGVYMLPWATDSWALRALAAVLAAGERAALSHASATHHWGLLRSARPPRIEILMEAAKPRAVKGVVVHCTRRLNRDVTTHRSIRITTVPRTICDEAWHRRDDLADVVVDAVRRRFTTTREISRCLDRLPSLRGARELRAVLREFDAEVRHAESNFEIRLRNALVVRGLPPPRMNPRLVIGGRPRRPDLAWIAEKVAVEAHGPHHELPSQRELDQTRDAEFTDDGWVVVYVTEDELADPDRLAEELAALLRARQASAATDPPPASAC